MVLFDTLIDMIKDYNEEEVSNVIKAYEYAKDAHKNQKRESGEPYIIHPINVCINLAKFKADGATLVAGMLHDVVEDTKYTLSDVEKEFGSEVAKLVDGVTKISNIHFSSLDEARDANIRRIITSLNEDVRIIIIKSGCHTTFIASIIFSNNSSKSRIIINIWCYLSNYCSCSFHIHI